MGILTLTSDLVQNTEMRLIKPYAGKSVGLKVHAIRKRVLNSHRKAVLRTTAP
jgi:hypothetical protein